MIWKVIDLLRNDAPARRNSSPSSPRHPPFSLILVSSLSQWASISENDHYDLSTMPYSWGTSSLLKLRNVDPSEPLLAIQHTEHRPYPWFFVMIELPVSLLQSEGGRGSGSIESIIYSQLWCWHEGIIIIPAPPSSLLELLTAIHFSYMLSVSW